MLTLQLTLAARYLWGRKLRTFLTTLAIGVIERTREIGTLRAIGATLPQVR